MASWHFSRYRPDDKFINPVQGEFFSEDAIEGPAQALVREAVQNCLDARAGALTQPVRVRFYASGDNGALPPERADFWLGPAYDHIRASGNGLRDAAAIVSGPCRFVVVEDFGTTGLVGDPSQWQPPREGQRNDFFSFFRAEGLSQKEETKGGRWGVGKTVFNRSSQLNTLFGLTVRSDDHRGLLMGRLVLMSHWLENESYKSDAFWGEPGQEGLILPSESDPDKEAFRRDFNLARAAEAGLSVVVPFADPTISSEAIIKAAVREYFLPILKERLEVIVSSPEGEATVSAASIRDSESRSHLNLPSDLASIVELAIWGEQAQPIVLDDSSGTGTPSWQLRSVPEALRTQIRRDFQDGENLSFEVPVRVHQRNSEPVVSRFKVLMKRDVAGSGIAPMFIRQDIHIPSVAPYRIRGHSLVSLVSISDEALSGLLGDAETPAHTHWSKDTRNFKGKYVQGSEVIEFVKQAPKQLADMLTAVDEESDILALADFFPSAANDEGPEEEDAEDDDGTQPPTPRVVVTRSPQAFQIEHLSGGFRVTKGSSGASLPRLAVIRVAYDISSGDPLRRYSPVDFQIENLAPRLTNANQLEAQGNMLRFAPMGDDFVVEVTGFDIKRDLYVRVIEGESDDSAT